MTLVPDPEEDGSVPKPLPGPARRPSVPPRFQIGLRVRIVRGLQTGQVGVVSSVNASKRRMYAVELGAGRYTYCAEADLEVWRP